MSLESLPLDILYGVLQFLHPDRSSKHSFLILALICRTLRNAVEAHCAHLLTKLFSGFPTSCPSLAGGGTRGRFLFHVWQHCRFCNRPSSRCATLCPEITCCDKCDEEQWPDKITMTEACKRYRITRKRLTSYGIPHVKCRINNIPTTLICRRDVLAAISAVHGDLATHFAAHASAALARRERSEQLCTSKIAHLRNILLANNLPTHDRFSKLLFSRGPYSSVPALEIARAEILRNRVGSETGNYRDRCSVMDKALFTLFCRDFEIAADEGEYERILKAWEAHPESNLWPDGAPKQFIVGRDRNWVGEVGKHYPPWSWQRFPVFIKDAPGGNHVDSVKWNDRAQAQMARIGEAVRERGLDLGEWEKRGKVP